MYDIIIIGAGTAGLSAAIYGVREGKKVAVFEGVSYGGQIINSPEVENYPGIKHVSGYEFATNLYEQAVDLGALVIFEQVVEIKNETDKKVVITSKGEYTCKSLIIATGSKKLPLGLANEDKYIGAGVSYCATCDGIFYRNRDVAIVGGGNTALEDAIFLSEYCNKVYVIHRRDSFRGENTLVETLKSKENVEFLLESVPVEFIGDDVVTGIKVKNVKDDSEKVVEVSGVFVAVGQQPATDIFKGLISLDDYGYINADENCLTNIDGIYVAGDCRTKKVRQLTTAASDGTIAAIAAF